MARPSRPAFLFFLATSLLPVGLHAQVDTPAILKSAHGLTRDASGLVGFGADYLARFDRGGLTFTPALGRQAATDQRLRLTAKAVRQGTRELALADVEPAAGSDRVTYQRSPAIEERFEVRADGVEQSFVFHQLPGEGELVVRCALDGELAGRAAVVDGGGLQFVVPGLGGATLGGVTGIDARGARCAGSVRLVGGALELALPADFVAHAALPLVLDPLIGARLDFAAVANDDIEPDVAYDTTTSQFCVVWTRVVSNASSQLYARLYHQTNGLGATLLLAADTVIKHATIASHNASERFLVVWERADGMIANSTLKACTIDVGFVAGTVVTLTTTGHCTDPDLSGNPGTTAGDLDGLVVWRDNGVGIQCARCTVPIGTQPVTFQAPVALFADPTVGPARISKAGNGTRLVACEIPGWVVAKAVDGTAAAVGTGWQFAIPGTQALRADVDGSNGSFVVVAEEEPVAGDRNLQAHQLALTGTTLSRTATGAIAATAADESMPAIALLGPKYVVAWSRTVGFLDSVVAVRSFAVDGCLACGVETLLTGTLQSEMRPAIGSRRSGGSTAPDALLVCASHGTAAPFNGDITGSMFTAFGATTTQAPLWGSCGNAATLAAVGTFSVGNPTFAFRTTTADPQAAVGIFAFGLGGASLQCGTCRFVSPVALLFTALSAGAANQALPVPCNAGLIGLGLDVQTAVLGAVTNQCPLLPSASTSPAIRFTVGE